MHDAVVVGAGPGGSATAYFLAQRGLDVLLVDRSDFPRDKTCGDGLTPRALRVLDDMQLLERVARLGHAIDGYDVFAPNSRSTGAVIHDPHGALVVPRRALDDTIRQHAVAAGATFEPRLAVSHVEPDPNASGIVIHAERAGRRVTERARVAVLATGAATGVLTRSSILHHRPRSMLAARAYFERLPPLPDRFQLRFDGVPLPGYGWVFPLGAGGANVGVGYIPTRSRPPTTRAAFDHFLSIPPLREQLAGARQVGPLKGYPIRVDFLQSPTYAQRTLLVGEAAGLVNPLTGEGIDYALESGQIAAQHLAALLAHDDLSTPRLAEYDAELRLRFERIFRFSQHVRDWYCVPPLLNLLVPLANRRPVLRQMLADVVLGSRQPSGRGPLRMLLALLVFLARRRP